MPNKFIFLVLIMAFLSPVSSWAQHSGQVTYNVRIGTAETPDNATANHFTKLAHRGAKKLTFILDYSGNQSKFYVKEDLRNNDRDAKIALAIAKYFSPIYTDLSKHITQYRSPQSPLSGNTHYIITDSLFSNWQLTRDTKTIQHLTCYKAIGRFTTTSGKTAKQSTLIAWYCPSIPNSFGPRGYGGLPGLILQLQVNNVSFSAKKIDLEQAVSPIKLPEDGTIITHHDYIKRMKNRVKSMRR